MQDLSKIIRLCKKQNKAAQKHLYDVYSPVLFGICLRYGSDRDDAEDILQKGFIKILTKIKQYRDEGSFEGWMKRIMVNTAISHYHKHKKHRQNYDITEAPEVFTTTNEYGAEDFTAEELLKVIQSLPEGYRTVFNLYAVEGFKHKEIAEQLDININTSKSQYSRAKKLLQQKLAELQKINLNEQDQ
jgi:RNA polymerase sigma factor (sigma-70 family)